MFCPEFICVIDFEATCDISERKHEVIEFPGVLLAHNFITGHYEKKSEIQIYCRPKEDPSVSQFCFELTGISQETVDKGIAFPLALRLHQNWIFKETGNPRSNIICLTCGDWDLKWMMKEECERWEISQPFPYDRYINIKAEFQQFYNLPKKIDMAEMLEHLKLSLEGRHHSGLDDCNNIVRIWKKMFDDGYRPDIKSFIQLQGKPNIGGDLDA